MTTLRSNTTVRKSISSSDKNWYSEDEISMIKKVEFEKGKEHFNKVQLEKYYENLLLAQTIAEEHFNSILETFAIKLKQIRLKPISIKSFELVFIMPETVFVDKDKFRSIVENGVEISDKYISKDFCVSFTYMPFTKSLNESAFILDGFMFTYDPFRKGKRD